MSDFGAYVRWLDGEKRHDGTLNPSYPQRRAAMNIAVEREYMEWPHPDSLGRIWLGIVACKLDHPCQGEEELFYEASIEHDRLAQERTR